MKAIYKVFLCLHGGMSPSWHRVSWQNKSTHQGVQCVFSSLIRPITKLMWIPACNETNLQADIHWKGKGIRETTLLINGFKLKTTSAKRGIAMLSVDKFPYPRKQTRGNEFIPCSNNICDILKRFRSFKIPAITLIWPKSYKHSVTRSYRSGKESGRRSESPLWRHQWRSFVFISHADDVKREIRLHISRC